MYKNYKNAKDRSKEMIYMLKQMAWNTFKNTGDINTFLELKQVTDIEENMKVADNENSKNQGNNYCRKNNV